MLYAELAEAGRLLAFIATNAATKSLPDASDDEKLRQVAGIIRQLTCPPTAALGPDALVVEQRPTPTRTTLTSLPFELVALVIENLDRRDVPRLALTCRYLSRPAVRRLHEHAVVGRFVKGESFCNGFRDDPGRLLALKSFDCDEWSTWQPWLRSLGGLPRIERALLYDIEGGVRLDDVFATVASWPNLRSLEIHNRCGTSARVTMAHEPIAQIVDLQFFCGAPEDYEAVPLQWLAFVLPGLRRLMIDASPFSSAGLAALDGFAHLESLTLTPWYGSVVGDWTGPGVARVIRRLRQITLMGIHLATRILVPNGPFSLPNASLETLVIFSIRSWAQIHPFMDRLACGGFPSLRRLLLMRQDVLGPSSQKLVVKLVPVLKAQGFGGHACHRLIHVERPPPERPWLEERSSCGAQQPRTFCTCPPSEMMMNFLQVDISGAWFSRGKRDATGVDAIDF